MLVNFSDTDLAGRTAARQVRTDIENAIANNDKVSISLKGVLSISHSYADELFAVLAEKYTDSVFYHSITVRGATKQVANSIVDAINLRAKR
jgi:hypothetical protein